MQTSYLDQLSHAREIYFDRDDCKGMGYLANLELGDWLTKYFSWDWYTTHTFKDDSVYEGKADKCWQSWFNSLILTCKAKGMPRPHYVRATEYQENRAGQPIHFHALIGGVGDTRRLLFKDLWEINGFARVVEYNPNLGAGFYLGKYLTKYDSHLRFSHNLKHRKIS